MQAYLLARDAVRRVRRTSSLVSAVTQMAANPVWQQRSPGS